MSKDRQIRKQEDKELLLKVQSGIPLDELYDEEEKMVDESSLEALMELDLEEPEEPEEKVVEEVVEEPEPIIEEKQEEVVDTETIVMNIVKPVLKEEELKEEEETQEFDYDLMHTKMLLAMEKNTKHAIQDWINKVFSKEEDEYPVHDKSSVRLSLAKAAKALELGGEEAKKARQALPKIRDAAKEFLIGQPSEKNESGLIVEKDSVGEYRFVGWLSGKWMDRDGDIIEEKAHKEFVRFLEKNEDWKIVFRSWHTPGTDREHEIDFWTYKNGFVLVSGRLTEPEAIRLMGAMQKQRIGMSHGFFSTRDPSDPRVINKYRTFEVSDLPSDNAAFPWSDIPNIIMEAKSMKTQLEYLSEVVSKEQLEKILEDAELKEQFLDRSGIEAKALDAFLKGEEFEEVEEPETKEVDEQEVSLTPEIVVMLKQALGIDDLQEFIKEARVNMALIPALQKQIEDQKVVIEKKSKDAEEQLVDLLTSGNSARSKALSNRASESKETEIDEDDEELKNLKPAHENSWLIEAAGLTE